MVLVDKSEIEKLIPQRSPMVMVHELLESSDHHAKTSLTIEPNNLFVRNGKFRESGLIENIAQTAAAQVGYQCLEKMVAVPIGYIAAIKNLKIFKLPLINSAVSTTVKVTNQIMDVTVVEGYIEQEGTVVCSCEMRIFAKF